MNKLDKPIPSLINILPQNGQVVWIGIRPKRKAELTEVPLVSVSIESGLEGDHFSSKRNTTRQVTLIQKEHLDGVASMLGMESIDPKLTRRNLVVQGINILALRNQKFKIGEVVFEGTGYCHPCSRMEENLGPGGYNAMRGHGGLTARVIQGGQIALKDSVQLIPEL